MSDQVGNQNVGFLMTRLNLCLLDEDEETGFVEKEPITPEQECYEYELIGVTVHTGTADGGHYYSFIRDKMSKSESGQDKW